VVHSPDHPPAHHLDKAAHSRSLDDQSDVAPENPPLVTVIVPARNEAHNIQRCVTSILATRYHDWS
jgi:cellulose synthase/poly-beta-1,6-N-acetylglucosamine synthase-like glycosyltransferase